MDKRQPERHLVAIHGAWQGSWSFDRWKPWLIEKGWQVHAIDLPGNGITPLDGTTPDLQTYTAHVCNIVRKLEGEVVLVGHSGGGITASQVAEEMPERISALVYLAGMMLPSGVSYASMARQCATEFPEVDFSGITPYLRWNEDRTWSTVTAEAAQKFFFHDCDEMTIGLACKSLCAQPETGRAMAGKLSAARFGLVPRIYVECHHDRSILLQAQRRMQKETPGAQVIAMTCGHVPHVSHPGLLTSMLLPVLDTLLAK